MEHRGLLPVVLLGLFIVCGSLVSVTGLGIPLKPPAADGVSHGVLEILKKHYQSRNLKPPASLEAELGKGAAAATGANSSAVLQASLSALFYAQFGVRDMVLYQDQQQFQAIHDNAETAPAGAAGCRLAIWFHRKGARTFVQDLLLPSPGTERLKAGDEIVSFNGEPFSAAAFYAKAEPCPRVKLAFRHGPWDKVEETTVPMIRGDYTNIFLEAMLRSKRVMTIAGKSIGYLHLFTDGDERELGELKKVAQEFNTTTVAWIVDLRGGVNGQADLLQRVFDAGSDAKEKKIYDKPLFLLIDRETGGSRELLAGHLKERKAATLVGASSQGGHDPLSDFFFMDDSWLVRLPFSPPKDGESTVYSPIVPDIAGDDTLVYAGGYDAILQKALTLAQHL